MKTIRHLIDPEDFTKKELDALIALAKKMYLNPEKYNSICTGKILATLFYEPSTRTRLSFESAMLRLGGQVLGFSDASTSSVSKGENIADTIRVISNYADIAVIRHPKAGAPKLASKYAHIPIINGGDGAHQHPTQTLTDLLTIHMYKASFENQTVAFCGDLKFGRTVHSLIRTLARYNLHKFILISPKELSLPDSLKEKLIQNKVLLKEVSTLEEVIDEIDILYMTRIQKERFLNEADYNRLKGSYILNSQQIKNAKKDMIIMHPLPRVDEIAYELDKDPRAVYFEQAKLGVYVRMALITKLLNVG
ncbi:aspartate carbamoyltransferase [Crassaminicella indica]|uniref:Aspartate carbamoyltransferase n=1 Tax=Crassaminicella indica TaxID=2855394 RepID=A0ABX8R9L4_9CLOT|nr:aspartate carbamoyltransferase [Crassaminicella indica]QXM05154.1 aspartate carbamoyltransferase [Crassaminicella indica]